MPLYDYVCEDCGKSSELLVFTSDDPLQCKECGSSNLKRILSAHSSMSGPTKNTMPGPGDTACCGSSPGAAGCAGPGSCCGKNFG